MQKAVFFDRDGILVEDRGLIRSLASVQVLPGALDLLLAAKNLGYLLFLVTNQTLSARGMLSIQEQKRLNDKILERVLAPFAVHEIFCDVYICPTHPQAQVIELREDSWYRKPKPGMLVEAMAKHQILPWRSFMLGDRISDVVCGNLAGCQSILRVSHTMHEPLVVSNLEIVEAEKKPHFTVQHLSEVTGILYKGAYAS